MNTSINEALTLLDLQPGQPYRTTVNGQEVEVRLLEKADGDEPAGLADQEAMDLWLAVPPSPLARTLSVRLRGSQLPSPYRLDEADLAPE